MATLDLSGRQYAHVPFEEKERLFEEVKKDLRYEEYLYGCYECGICVAACPSARFYDFSPRKIAQTMAREDVDLFYTLLNDSVWDCSQCFSCDVCPRKNSPGGIITLMRTIPTIISSARGSLKDLSAAAGASGQLRTERDIPMMVVLGGSLLLGIFLAVTPGLPTQGNVVAAVLVLIFGFFFATVSSRITGIIGSSSNPISGMTIATLILRSEERRVGKEC